MYKTLQYNEIFTISTGAGFLPPTFHQPYVCSNYGVLSWGTPKAPWLGSGPPTDSESQTLVTSSTLEYIFEKNSKSMEIIIVNLYLPYIYIYIYIHPGLGRRMHPKHTSCFFSQSPRSSAPARLTLLLARCRLLEPGTPRWCVILKHNCGRSGVYKVIVCISVYIYKYKECVYI